MSTPLMENEMAINCLCGDGNNTLGPFEIKPVFVAVHSSNLWIQNNHGWGFSIDKDLAILLLNKIAKDVPMIISVHDNLIADRLSDVLMDVLKDHKIAS